MESVEYSSVIASSSISSITVLPSSTLSATLGEFNAIKKQKMKGQEKEVQNKLASRVILCEIHFWR